MSEADIERKTVETTLGRVFFSRRSEGPESFNAFLDRVTRFQNAVTQLVNSAPEGATVEIAYESAVGQTVAEVLATSRESDGEYAARLRGIVEEKERAKDASVRGLNEGHDVFVREVNRKLVGLPKKGEE